MDPRIERVEEPEQMIELAAQQQLVVVYGGFDRNAAIEDRSEVALVDLDPHLRVRGRTDPWGDIELNAHGRRSVDADANCETAHAGTHGGKVLGRVVREQLERALEKQSERL
jgi:hypothetical protein